MFESIKASIHTLVAPYYAAYELLPLDDRVPAQKLLRSSISVLYAGGKAIERVLGTGDSAGRLTTKSAARFAATADPAEIYQAAREELQREVAAAPKFKEYIRTAGPEAAFRAMLENRNAKIAQLTETLDGIIVRSKKIAGELQERRKTLGEIEGFLKDLTDEETKIVLIAQQTAIKSEIESRERILAELKELRAECGDQIYTALRY